MTFDGVHGMNPLFQLRLDLRYLRRGIDIHQISLETNSKTTTGGLG